MPIFEIYDNKKSRRVQTDLDQVTLGRTGDIVVDDRVASRIHCEIRASDVGYILHDLQSRNGTSLNLELIDRPVSLRDGDEIGIGKATVRFWLDPAHSNTSLPLIALATKPDSRQKTQAAMRVSHNHEKKTPVLQDDASDFIPRERLEKLKVVSRNQAEKPSRAMPKTPRLNSKKTISNSNLQIVEQPLNKTLGHRKVEPGELTIDDIIPLNAEGKPAHAVDQETGEISEAMYRLKEILLKSFHYRSTDIHIEPKEEHFQLRYRIDGYLHVLGTLENQIVRSIFSIVKLLCNLDINIKNIMHDGSFDVRLPDRRVQLRVSIAPSITGEKMVLRVLDTNLAPQGLGSLGMESYVLEQVRQKSAQNSSMIVVCGPTGSGKTTTVYAILNEMNSHNRNIVTVEQPVEYKLDSVSQIEVSPENARGAKITFATALRSLLRQDPDVILVGEIRDTDTAHMAVQAAMTGHLLLTTVHARDSIGCIFRMLDLGVEPFLLSSALTAVLSQRLMRKLCDRCKSKVRPAIGDLSRVGLDELAGKDLYTAVGCDHCLGIGYKGRIPIFELLSVNDQVRDAIANRPTIQQLRIAAGDWIFQTLREDGVRKLRNGLTNLDEFISVAHHDS